MTPASTAARGAALAAPLAVATATGVGTYILMFVAFQLFVPDSAVSPLWLPGTAAVVAVMVRCPRPWWGWVVAGFTAGEVVVRAGAVSWTLIATQVVVNAVEVVVASVILTGRRDYGGIAAGWAREDTTGFCKVLADPATGLLLGAHIIGPEAATVIQPALSAMQFGIPAHEFARGQYWIHPALPELLENALLDLPAPIG